MGAFRMPSLGADMEAGTVSRWLVNKGDEVRKGDIVAVVDTEKSTIEVEIFESGVVDDIVVPEGQRVPVGAVLATVSPAGTDASPMAAAPVPTTVPVPTLHSPVIRHLGEQLGVDMATLKGSGPGGALTRADVEGAAARATAPAPAPAPSAPRTRSSPLARRLAGDLGVDIGGISGTGPGRAVVERDVRRAAPATRARTVSAPPVASAPPPAPATATSRTSERMSAMRRATGNLMARSKREVPHYYLSTTIDLAAASRWLELTNLERPLAERLVMPVLLIKATALAVGKVPEMNGYFVDGAFVPARAVHVGVAISMRAGGLIAPAIHDADRLSLDETMGRLHDLVGRARRGVLRSSEMSDPTITVTNLGDLGVEAVFGVIYPPQVALVGFGRVGERPVARGGMVGAAPCVTASLSADHRVSDGHRGGRFLSEIARLLDEPEKL